MYMLNVRNLHFTAIQFVSQRGSQLFTNRAAYGTVQRVLNFPRRARNRKVVTQYMGVYFQVEFEIRPDVFTATENK